jgi:hypothetical protein
MLNKQFFKRKSVRILLGTLAITVILLVGVQIFVSTYLPKLIRNRITYLVVNGSDGLYQCSIGDISVSLLGGIVKVDNVQITIDSSRYKLLDEQNKVPDVTFEVHLKEGAIHGLNLWSFIFYERIRLNTIKADDADITIYSQFNPARERRRAKIREIQKLENEKAGKPEEPISEQRLWRLIEPKIKGIYVNWVFLDHIKFSYKKAGEKNEMKVEYDNLSASLKAIRIDSIGAAEKDRILFTEDLSLSFTGLRYYTEDSLYKLNMDTMIYSSFSKNIFVRGFGVGPTISPEEFTKKIGHQVDVFEVDIPEINIYNFQIDKIFSENSVSVDTVVVQKLLLKIHHDRTASPDTVVKYGQYPNEALLKMPVKLKIPTVLMFDCEVHYIEKQAKTFQIGDGFFTHVSGTINNLTNDSAFLANDGHLRINMEGFFLHSGRMTAEFDFDLSSPNGKFSAKADLGRMNERELNIMTIPFGNMQMKSADLKEAHFNLQGNHDGTTGTLRMIYNNLNVELLMKGKKDHKMKKDGFMTFLANLVGVRKNNPAENGKETIAENIRVKRTPVMPFFNMIWKTLFGGMKDVMLKGPAKNIKIGQEE